MEEIIKGILSKYKKPYLENILLNQDNASQVIISDLDGTIHKGLWNKRLKGITNADLGVLTTFYLLSKPKLLPKYITNNIEFFFYEKKNRPLNSEGVSKFDEELMKSYFNNKIKGIPKEALEKAAVLLPKLAYRKSKESIIELGKNSKKTTIISKTVDIILESYANWFKSNHLNLNYQGNELVFNEGLLKHINPSITTAIDKKERCEKEINGYERCIVFGDTCQDLGMFEAADDLRMPSIKVAVHSRSEELSKKADIVLYSWKNFYKLLKKKV